MNKNFKKQDESNNGLVYLMDDVLYAREAQAVLMMPNKAVVFMDEKHLEPVPIGKYNVAERLFLLVISGFQIFL